LITCICVRCGIGIALTFPSVLAGRRALRTVAKGDRGSASRSRRFLGRLELEAADQPFLFEMVARQAERPLFITGERSTRRSKNSARSAGA
jgi:hypothetical protein